MENPLIRQYINAEFGGMWPFDWLMKAYPELRFDRVLSIGCGTGALERDLIQRGLSNRINAFDGSMASIRLAQEFAA